MPAFLRSRRATLIAIAVAATGVGAYALVHRSRDAQHLVEASPSTATTRAFGPSASPEIAASPLASANADARRSADAAAAATADAAPPSERVAALRRGLASEDEATRIAAVEAAVSVTAVETLDDLEKFELARDPETAPTVIHAVALLGASAEGPKREGAAGTLDRWLHDEMRRDGPDVLGNISNLVEALGDVGGREAVDALGAALDRAEIGLHVQTLAVEKLGELGDARARGPVERFATRVGAMPQAEGLDEELRVEALEAARSTLSKI